MECDVLAVDARPAPGESPEERARKERYRTLAGLLRPDECLLTAHHRDDQAETVLTQLLRGAGPAGLASMPAAVEFGGGLLLRPLLEVGAGDILAYAEAGKLAWIEDPANSELGLSRNFLRHEIMPLLKGHWPGMSKTLARAAGHQAQAAALLEVLAAQDLETLAGGRENSLDLARLQRLPAERQANALRGWRSATLV